MSNYNKFKDSTPRETVHRIQEILSRAGIFTTMNNVSRSHSGACSGRVSIYPTDLGTNGKGTDELYSCASGYAELMERMQNNLLAIRLPRPRVTEHGEFSRFPDEKVMAATDLIEQHDPFFDHVFEMMGCSDPLQKYIFITKFALYFENRSDGMITCVPYADVSGGRVVYIPDYIVVNVFGSNGMAAGNTIEEAMVQGMCEIYERYANSRILMGDAVPPEIPSDEFKQYSLWDLIEEIEEGGRYRVSIRDCSLGKGLPVAASVITDTETGRFGIKFGSHPSMAVAVERTLTEAFQGRELDVITDTCCFGTPGQSTAYHNIPNMMKVGVGVYPAAIFSGKPDWEYRPWTEWEGPDNRGFLRKMLDMAERDGLDLLIRDNSHMGFPTVQILVPGYSDMYQVCDTWYRCINTGYKGAQALGHFPDLTDAEERSLLNIIKFKENSFIENGIPLISLRPFRRDAFSTDRIAAFTALGLGEFADAHHFLSKLIRTGQNDAGEKGSELVYYNALDNYCRGRLCGLDREAAVNLVAELFDAGITARVKDEVTDTDGILKRNFPATKCFDCESCEISGSGCSNAAEEEVLIRIKDAMKDSMVSQTELLGKLDALMKETAND